MSSVLWLRSRCPARDGAAEQPLQPCDEFGVRQRPAVSFGAAHRCEGGFIARIGSEKPRKIAHAVKHRFNGHEIIVLPGQMGPQARPRPILGPRNEPGANRIKTDIANPGDQSASSITTDAKRLWNK